MKAKYISSLVIALFGFLSLSSNASVTIDTSSCSWVQVSSSYYAVVSSLQCNGFIPVTKTVNPSNGGSCSITANSPYAVTGTCNSFTVTGPDPVTPPAQTACQLSGKAGLYITTGYSSGVVAAAQQAAQACSPCGTYTVSVSGGYAFYCNKQ